MQWFNGFWLVFLLVIMVPNVVFATRRNGFENKWKNMPVELMAQIGRFGCFGFMVFSIPGVCFGWPSDEALALSILPSVLFLFSRITSRAAPQFPAGMQHKRGRWIPPRISAILASPKKEVGYEFCENRSDT